MIKSMTGYGRGELILNGRKLIAEVRSVNNRYLDCSVKLPRAYLFAEESVKTRVGQVAARGKIDVFFTIEELGTEALSVQVNEMLAGAYLDALEQLRALGENRGVIGAVSPVDLAQFPNVLTVEKRLEDQSAIQEDLQKVLDLALEDFDRMRIQEGSRLAQDILGRADVIEDYVGKIEARSPQTVTEYRTRMEEKLQELLKDVPVDPARVLTEAAIFADKVCVDEETVRLRSHVAQLRQLLDKGGATGRKLDFLIQEFNREANTIGSKCNDIQMSEMVLEVKSEIEKIREQVQNIE